MQRISLQLVVLLTAAVLLLAACAQGEKVIRIGAAVSETGRYAIEGSHTRAGYEIWEEWVNDEYGGINVGGERYRAELIMYDDRSDPETTAMLIDKLVDEDKVDFLLGPYSSTLTQPAIQSAEAKGVILVEGSGSSEALFEQSFKNLFAVLTPARNYTQSALEALAGRGAKSVAIAYADTLFPRSLAEGARHWAGEYGMEVLAMEPYEQGISDVSGIVSRFKDMNPDVFVGGGYYDDTVLFVEASRTLGFNPEAMVLTVGPTNPLLVDEVGSDANFLIGPTQWESSMSYRGDYFGSAADYAERYKQRWGSPPTYQSANATAAALALQLGIQSAGTLDTDAVRDALRKPGRGHVLRPHNLRFHRQKHQQAHGSGANPERRAQGHSARLRRGSRTALSRAALERQVASSPVRGLLHGSQTG